MLTLERDLQSHRIEVTAPGTAGWRVEYVAGADAAYRVVLPATGVEAPAAPASPDRKARGGRRRSGDGPPILGEPGF